MERLTERTEEGFQCNDHECRLSYCDRGCGHYQLMVNKLAEYEEAEKQGLLLRLPCKVGDKAYYVHKGGIDEVEVDSFIANVNIFVNVSLYIGCDRFGKTLTPYKTLFFSKEAAEQALKQMGE